MIGIHTPRTEAESDINNVRQKIKDNAIAYPVAVDGLLKNWESWDVKLVPTIFLVDKKGQVRYRWDGELSTTEANGDQAMRKKIEALLTE